MKYKIEFEREKCRGCGACTICENWKFDSDGKVSPIKTEFDKLDCNMNAEEMCPMGIIHIREFK